MCTLLPKEKEKESICKSSLYIMHSGVAIPIELDSMYDTSANAYCIEFHVLQTIRLHIDCHECRDPIVWERVRAPECLLHMLLQW